MNTATDQRIRVGAVNYINALPLIRGFSTDAPNAELVLAVPSRLATMLADGELDVALIPVIEYFRADGYTVVRDICIGSRAEVLSVQLFSRVPFDDIKSIALDEGSRSSAALAQIFLRQCHQCTPRVEPFDLDATLENLCTDALLLIGDRAMSVNSDMFAYRIDLGAAWTEWTGKPFVWAVWAVQPGIDLRGMDDLLLRARDRGLSEIPAIARHAAQQNNLPEQLILDYLSENLCFTLGEQELEGLDIFYRFATELGLAPEGKHIEYYRSHDLTARR